MNGITSDRSGSRLPKWSRLECEGREGADQGLDIGDARRDGVEDLDWGKGPRQVPGSDLGDIRAGRAQKPSAAAPASWTALYRVSAIAFRLARWAFCAPE